MYGEALEEEAQILKVIDQVPLVGTDYRGGYGRIREMPLTADLEP